MSTPRKPTSDLFKSILLAEGDGLALDPKGVEIPSSQRSVDHITSLSAGGTNSMTNLQFMSRDENRKKGAGPDVNWSNRNYFDTELDYSKLRYGQLAIVNKILSKEYQEFLITRFDEAVQLNQLCCQVTGAGKSIAIYVLPFSINETLTRFSPHHPRIKRVLIVTKDQSIRDQIARDLVHDPFNFGITRVQPKVGIPRSTSDLADLRWVEQFDFVVVCIQSLWESGDDFLHDNLKVSMLSHFQLVAVDEPHFANRQFHRLNRLAHRSLFFGFTASPVSAKGEVLENLVLFDLYDYQTAVEKDQSMKYLPDPDAGDSLFAEVKPTSVHVQRGSNKFWSDDVGTIAGYAQNIKPQLSVMEATIQEMKRCDLQMQHSKEIAPHRKIDGGKFANVKVELRYPIHAIIVVGSIEDGKRMELEANRYMEANRDLFPLDEGFEAHFAYGDKGLDKSHPWYGYKNKQPEFARLLILCNIGREGINNPYQGIVGLACKSESMVEHAQRTFGRSLRGVQKVEGDCLIVPPRCLDEVKVIVHPAFDVKDTLIRSARFMLNMRSYLEDIPTIEDVMSGPSSKTVFERPVSIDGEAHITSQEKRIIFEVLNDGAKSGIDIAQLESRVEEIFKNESQGRKKNASAFVKLFKENPEKALEAFTAPKTVGLMPHDVVLEETRPKVISDAEILFFMQQHEPALAERYHKNHHILLEFGRSFYERHQKRLEAPTLLSLETIDEIKKRMRSQFRRESLIAGSYVDEIDGKSIHGEIAHLINVACKQVFGAGSQDTVGKNSIFDTPYHQHILSQESVRRKIFRWLERQLNDQGFFPKRMI